MTGSMITGGEIPADTGGEEQTTEQIAAAAEAAKTEEARVAALSPEEKATETAAATKVEEDRVAALSPEEKAAEEKATKDKADAEAKNKADNQVPEKYEDFKMPEGVELDGELAKEFGVLGREVGLSQEKAQKMVDFYAKNNENVAKQTAEAVAKNQVDEWDKTQEGWIKDTKSDKDIGGDKLQEALANSSRFVKAYGNEAFAKLLDDYGLGNHPEVIRALSKAGKLVKEDQLVVAGNPAGAGGDNRTPGQVMFPDMKS